MQFDICRFDIMILYLKDCREKNKILVYLDISNNFR